MTTTYRAQTPEIPSPAEGEYTVHTMFRMPGSGVGPLVEEGEVLPDEKVTAYRKKVRTVPARPPAELGYWPVWVDAATGEPADPQTVTNAVLDGDAQLASDEREVNAVLDVLRRLALVPADELKPYRRPIGAPWVRGKRSAADAVASLPRRSADEPMRTLTLQEMLAIFKTSRRTLLKWADQGRIPRPIVVSSGGRGNTYRWDEAAVREKLTGVKPAERRYDFQAEAEAAQR